MPTIAKFCKWCGSHSDNIRLFYQNLHILNDSTLLVPATCAKCKTEYSIAYKIISSKVIKKGLVFKNNKEKMSQAN